MIPSKTIARSAMLLVLTLALSACALPRSGPNKKEIFAGSVERQGDAFVVDVDDRVVRATAVVPAYGFTKEFLNVGVVGSDTIQPGDRLALTVWENVENGLLGGAGTGSGTGLADVQVDGEGYIYVPYAGRIRASGNSPEALRRIITNKLAEQTPDPQVLITRAPGDGATVTLTGKVGGQGIHQIERPTRRLTAMLAKAGGVTVEPEIATVTIFRGHKQAKIWFSDLYKNPKYDIALRGGDRILVEGDTRTFTALGATGQSRVPFESQTISAIEAIAQIGGLSSNAADPTGVFVFRNEPAHIANQVLGRTDLVGPQRIAYLLNLTKPNGVFVARDFVIRDGDTVYVTEAPFVQWSKTINALLGTLTAVNTINSITK